MRREGCAWCRDERIVVYRKYTDTGSDPISFPFLFPGVVYCNLDQQLVHRTSCHQNPQYSGHLLELPLFPVLHHSDSFKQWWIVNKGR